MGAARRIADGGNEHGVGAVTSTNVRLGGPQDLLGFGGDFRHRRLGIHRRPGSLAGTTDPGGQAGNRSTAYAGQEALYKASSERDKASSERGQVAGISPGPSKFTWPKRGCGWTSGGSRTLRQCRCRCESDPQYCVIVYVCRRSERPDSRAADAGSRNPRRADLAVAVYSPVGGICGIRTVSTAIG